MNTEEIYDEQIAPLMTKIIEICKENKIGLHSSFKLSNEYDEEVYCHSCLPAENGYLLNMLYLMIKCKGNIDSFVLTLLKEIEQGRPNDSIFLHRLKSINE